MAEELLGENELRNDGILDPVPVREKWCEHLYGHRNWHLISGVF